MRKTRKWEKERVRVTKERPGNERDKEIAQRERERPGN